MARLPAPHFIGLFGAIMPLVMESMIESEMPTAIARVRPEFRGPLIGTLGCDLARGFISNFRWGQQMFWTAATKARLLDELGGVQFRSVQCKLRGCKLRLLNLYDQEEALDFQQYHFPELGGKERGRLLLMRKKRLFGQISDLEATATRLSTEAAASSEFRDRFARCAERDGHRDGRVTFTLDNVLGSGLWDKGPPYHLRNTDPSWWERFLSGVRRRALFEAIPRGFALRDPSNFVSNARDSRGNAILQSAKETSKLLARQLTSTGIDAEPWGLREEDVSTKTISSVSATCRGQDDCCMQWLDQLGKRDNPYTRWLASLSSSATKLDREWLEKRVSLYVPATLASKTDELEYAQLCWTLAQLNPKAYPYKPIFSAEFGQSRGEQLLAAWGRKATSS